MRVRMVVARKGQANLHVYVPTATEKKEIERCCREVVEAIEHLSFEQQAMVLKIVTDGFARAYDVDSIQVVRDGK